MLTDAGGTLVQLYYVENMPYIYRILYDDTQILILYAIHSKTVYIFMKGAESKHIL